MGLINCQQKAWGTCFIAGTPSGLLFVFSSEVYDAEPRNPQGLLVLRCTDVWNFADFVRKTRFLSPLARTKKQKAD